MQHKFSFRSALYDFWSIYETIKKYYPIGVYRGEGKGIYFEYDGIKELEKIVEENTHNQLNFHDRWVNFTKQIGDTIGKEIEGTTYGQAPSFSSFVIIQKNKIENCIHRKELHFAVSLIGNFYQIYGLDTTIILDPKEGKAFSAVNVVTTSPFAEFATAFELVEQKIKEKYPNHKIIPFGFGQTIIKGLQVRYLDDEDCSINKALFNHFLSEEYISTSRRGDEYYGKEQWLKQK